MGRKGAGQHYLWFDTEYTTLDLERAHLLQVSLVITDIGLKRPGDAAADVDLCVRLAPEDPVDPWVQENLAPLVVRSRTGDAVSVEEADAQLAARVDELLGPPHEDIRRRPVLAGNSVHADWFLVRRFLPQFNDRLHYRLLDVTSVKLQWHHWFRGGKFDKNDPNVVRKWFPDAVLADGLAPHDAYYDVQASIAELACYRHHLRRRKGTPE